MNENTPQRGAIHRTHLGLYPVWSEKSTTAEH